ncbi:MAG: anthranilate synthase component II [Marinifilaceae bacterium]
MKLLLLDNYDSFTYNLYLLFSELNVKMDVVRNDKIDLDTLSNYDGVVLSPGPGIPAEAGKMLQVIQQCAGRIPILGVCLGHQAIAEAFGGELINLSEVFHGIQSPVYNLYNDTLFADLDSEFNVGRYHSWVVNPVTLPDCLEVTAISAEGQIMALKHKDYNIRGVQFHPESILTPSGKTMITNFIQDINNYEKDINTVNKP